MPFKPSTKPRRQPVPVMFRDNELDIIEELSKTLGKNRSETIRYSIYLVYKKVFNREPENFLDKPKSVL